MTRAWTSALMAAAFLSSPVGANAAEAYLSASQKIELAADAARCWQTIQDFGSWHEWHKDIAHTEIRSGKPNVKGEIRVLTTRDGAAATEQLVAWQDKAMVVTYRALETALPVTDYVATLKVTRKKAGCELSWRARFRAKDDTLDDQALRAVNQWIAGGLQGVKARLRRAP